VSTLLNSYFVALGPESARLPQCFPSVGELCRCVMLRSRTPGSKWLLSAGQVEGQIPRTFLVIGEVEQPPEPFTFSHQKRS
jgi:hypothetical protein